MATKYLSIGSAGIPQQTSTVGTSAGAGDQDKIPSLDSSGKLDISFMPTGVGGDTQTLTAGEALSAGNLVYISASGTVLKADANSEAKEAVGFVLSSVSNGASGTVYMGSGVITGLSSLTAGSRYFLSNSVTGGVATYASLTYGSGDIIQYVGRAISTTSLYFEPHQPIAF